MADDSTVRLVLRGHTIASDIAITKAGSEQFVAVPNPPPVRSLIEVLEGGESRAFEITRLAAGADARGAGVYGRFVDDGSERLGRVGSENLAPGPALPSEPSAESGSSYPVPAPVLDTEPSEAIDVRDPEAAASADEGPTGEGAPSRGKKRKGRKRG